MLNPKYTFKPRGRRGKKCQWALGGDPLTVLTSSPLVVGLGASEMKCEYD